MEVLRRAAGRPFFFRGFVPLLFLIPAAGHARANSGFLSGEILVPAVFLPWVLWLLFSVVTRRFGMLYRLFFRVYMGLLMGSLAMERVWALIFGFTYTGLSPLFPASLILSGALITGLAARLSMKAPDTGADRKTVFLSSLSSAGMVVFTPAALVALGVPLFNLIIGKGEASAIRFAVFVSLVILLGALYGYLSRGEMRDRQISAMISPSPAKPRIWMVLLFLLLFFLFMETLTCSGVVL